MPRPVQLHVSRAIQLLVVALLSLAALVGLTAPVSADADEPKPRLTREHRQAGSHEFRIVTASARNDMISGGDVLVRVEVSSPVRLDRVTVALNGRDVTRAFRPVSGSRALLGLVEGLQLGDNTLVVKEDGRGQGGRAARLTLTNYPVTGPILSGPHQRPFICMTESFSVAVTGGTLGPPLDEDCSIATRVDYIYKSTDGTLKPLPSLTAHPGDLAFTTTLTGATVPYIVRAERGTINRAIYEMAILHDPLGPAPEPWAQNPGWNRHLIYTFGGGCPGGWYIQGRTTAAYGPDFNGNVMDDVFLSQGYATASASLNVFGNNCNDLLAAETMMMVKERFIERHGAPRFTIGYGCSGGSYQVHQIGDNYPGLLDGIIPGCSFPEVGFATIHTVTDARLLHRYFTVTAPGLFTREQQRSVAGFLKWEAIANLDGAAARIDPDAICNAAIPRELIYNAVTNPDGARCSVYDHTVNVYGRDKETGFARRPLDNVGVQYGLAALNAGVITKGQFLDLNERIGGFDIDANHLPERTVADRKAVQRAYESGRILNGGGGLADMPMIDYRAYSDDLPNGDIHMRFHGFSTRERLIKANGHADNQVMLVEDIRHGFYSSRSPVLRAALGWMDQWLTNLAADTSDDPRGVKVLRAKPADLLEACWTREAVPQRIVEQQVRGAGQCDALYPAPPAPREVAGASVANDVIKCHLMQVELADYAVTFSPAELQRLRRIFPDGVCDWTNPGVKQRPLKDTWLSFGLAGAHGHGEDDDD